MSFKKFIWKLYFWKINYCADEIKSLRVLVWALLTVSCRLKYLFVGKREWSRDLQEVAEAWILARGIAFPVQQI